MFLRSRFAISQSSAFAVCFVFHAGSIITAQNFTARSFDLNPFGVNGTLPFGMPSTFGSNQGIKGGFALGVGFSTIYDSNVLLSENNPESDVSLNIAPNFSYTTDPEGGAPLVINASYAPVATNSFSNSDYNSFDQSGNVAIVYSAARTTISAFAGISQSSGTDSLAASQGFFTGSAISLGLQAGYQLAPRTSVNASLLSSITDYGSGTTGSSAVGATDYSANLGGSWAATERFSFGPNFGYTTSSSDSVEDFNTWSFSMQGNYKATDRIQIAASLGFQYSEFSEAGASNQLSPSGSLNANYYIDELWSWSGSIQSGLTPSPTGSGSVINGWSISSNLNRRLIIGSAGIGILMDFSNYQNLGPVSGFQPQQKDQQNIGLLLNYSRPLPFFNERMGFASSVIYTVNYGDPEYTQVLLNAGLNFTF